MQTIKLKGAAHRIQVRPERYISMKNSKNKNALSNDTKTAQKVQEEKFLKTGEVAKLLNVNRDTILDWTKKGFLISDHTTNGYNYYTKQQVSNFLQTAGNLLAKSQNCRKSPTIKNKTAGNLEKRYIGRTDEPLCELGIAELKAGRYPGCETVIASPMVNRRMAGTKNRRKQRHSVR